MEALNTLNHRQFVNLPEMSGNGTPPGRFLNLDFTDTGIRSMWVQEKLIFLMPGATIGISPIWTLRPITSSAPGVHEQLASAKAVSS